MLSSFTLTLNNFAEMAKNFNWHSPSWDLFVFLFWVGAAIFYSFAAGRGRVISLLMSLYLAKLLVLQAPWLSNVLGQKLTGTLFGLQQLISFLLIFILLFILLSRFAFRTSVDGRQLTFMPFVFVFAFLQVGLLINTILTYLSASGKQFAPLINFLFIGNIANFVWLLLPLLFLIFMGRMVADATEV